MASFKKDFALFMRTTYLILYLIIVLSACKKDQVDTYQNSGNINIRIQNSTVYQMKELIVDTSGGINDFGTLNANMYSGYKRFDKAYRYAFVSFKINGTTYFIQPVDYVGEEPLANGSYTYKIMLDKLEDSYARLEFIVENK